MLRYFVLCYVMLYFGCPVHVLLRQHSPFSSHPFYSAFYPSCPVLPPPFLHRCAISCSSLLLSTHSFLFLFCLVIRCRALLFHFLPFPGLFTFLFFPSLLFSSLAFCFILVFPIFRGTFCCFHCINFSKL